MLEAFLIVCTWLAIFIAAALAIPAVFAVGAFIGLVAGLIIAITEAVGGEYIRLHIGAIGAPIRVDNPNNKNLVALCMLCAV